MSIAREAYQLCKSVIKSSAREQVSKIIFSLNVVTENDRSHFGYIARQQYSQILGYLLVDQERETFEQTPLPEKIANLSEEERQILSAAHKRLINLNKVCIESFINELPKCAIAVDPYNGFPEINFTNHRKLDIYDSKSANKLIRAFHNHPAFSIAQDNFYDTQENRYMEDVLTLDHHLKKAGVFDIPNDLKGTIMMESRESSNRRFLRFTISLVCIRASLAILNQLIFQALLSNKLPLLDENNVIEIVKNSGHLGGRGLSIIYQPNNEAHFITTEPGNLILVKIPDAKIDALFEVSSANFNFSKDFGNTVRVDVREIDDNLNPYGSTLSTI